MTAFPNRYIHSFVSLKKAYEENQFGEILGIKATNKGEMPGSWFVDKSLSGGGCIIDHTVHVADLLNTLFDSMPLSVQAFGEHRLYPGLEVEDVALVTLRYPNGVKVSLDSSWSRMHSYPYSRDLTLHIVGTKDCCRINYFAESYQIYSADANKALLHYYGEDKDQKMIDDLIDCYQQQRVFPITGLQGCKSALVAIAALKSTELTRTVFLSEIITPELKEFLL
jgi:predicted dehydrogenase